MSVTEYLERARECAEIADKLAGAEKEKLLAVAEAWLKLADDAAKEALKSGIVIAPNPQSKNS